MKSTPVIAVECVCLFSARCPPPASPDPRLAYAYLSRRLGTDKLRKPRCSRLLVVEAEYTQCKQSPSRGDHTLGTHRAASSVHAVAARWCTASVTPPSQTGTFALRSDRAEIDAYLAPYPSPQNWCACVAVPPSFEGSPSFVLPPSDRRSLSTASQQQVSYRHRQPRIQCSACGSVLT